MRIPSANPQAIACVRGGMGAPKLRGTVRFSAVPGGTLVTAEVSGLPENDSGFFAFHIHEGSDCGGTDFSDTGGHYNPDAREHPRHAGDLPPLLSMGGRADGGHSRKHGRFSHPTGGKRGQKNRLRRDTAGVMRGFFGNKEDYDEKLPFARFLWL